MFGTKPHLDGPKVASFTIYFMSMQGLVCVRYITAVTVLGSLRLILEIDFGSLARGSLRLRGGRCHAAIPGVREQYGRFSRDPETFSLPKVLKK